jgi:amino acid transporter
VSGVPTQAPRRSTQLGLKEVTASTVANIGTGEFYFAFGVIAVTAGIAAPLTIIAAGIAVFFLAFVVAEFTRMEPSAGSFITFVETSLGARAGAATALLIAVGFTVAIAGVFTIAGGIISLTLANYTSWDPSWFPFTLALTGGAIWLTARGVGTSTAVVAAVTVLQLAIMIAVCIVVLTDESGHLSGAPFAWSHLPGGLAGLSAGFPLALFMFIGWENGAALAEETRDPGRTIPRALYIALAVAVSLFVLLAYSTITGFHYETTSIGRSSLPFLELAKRYLGGSAIIVWLAGIGSATATLIAAVNSQSRVIFDGGRSGLLPRKLGESRPPGETPVTALRAMAAVGLGIVVTWWLCHETGLVSGPTSPVVLYAECSTMGTILILFVYVLTAASLPVFILRRHRSEFSIPRHVIVPLLAAASLVLPFSELFNPGQPLPYSVFPYLAVAALLAAVAYGRYTLARDPTAGKGEGTYVRESA